ncbi:hypothetical protein GCM10016455_05560 [Aliiroseovarius zhejiangensis]|uniref:DUF2171 domain-containing protein n=1 Tax=Aliiroseovarius zhejiangensis TaxID=1632025 RepID=A0ABQ3IMY0_9RHOB|nr:hypothetical protein [Aliiroseovarius zhejiangensis]GHE88314.1 hypothetical protein GCM10016455_05560 [Aliiroseovarius zhejiangensis]
MPSPLWEDLSEFFDPDEFAIEATIIRDNKIIGRVLGIFDDPTDRKEIGDYTLSEDGPRFLSPEDNALNAKTRDEVQIGRTRYDVVHNAVKNGTGLVVIELAEGATPHVAV